LVEGSIPSLPAKFHNLAPDGNQVTIQNTATDKFLYLFTANKIRVGSIPTNPRNKLVLEWEIQEFTFVALFKLMNFGTEL
jgi:hypothetical protein